VSAGPILLRLRCRTGPRPEAPWTRTVQHGPHHLTLQ